MSIRLAELVPDDYAAHVLPLSAGMWAGRRDEATYIRQTVEIARSPYGKRSYRTIGAYDGDELVASCKVYRRTLHRNGRQVRAIGFGAVFTPPEMRGRGYASAMLAMMCDRGRAAGDDLTYLFSDIKPAFYAALGFVELPSRLISLRADGLPGDRIAVEPLGERDWPAIARCFAAANAARTWGFERDATVWNWIRLRIKHGSEHPVGSQCNLAVRRGRSIAAYILGVRAPEHDAYIVDEYGYADAKDAALVSALLRAGAGDLRRVVGWLPPAGAREALPRGSVRSRRDAIFMALPLTTAGRKLIALAADPSHGDGVWSIDHV